ncbi:MAG: polyphosphate kinase 2 family protein [Trueperaceae bacterium]|nr:polyphosphate kinase 2 family protein [Trueperaceae bacterium]
MKVKTKDYIVKPDSKVKLKRLNPNDTGKFPDSDEGKQRAYDLLDKQIARLASLQNLLYADGSRALLVVLQALDAAGKDSTIRRVFSGINPQGVRVTSFKAPTPEELEHDFLWRIHRQVPRKGMIGVFNRSHYEDVLVVRVKNFVAKKVWSERYEQINEFEELLTKSGTKIVKFYLHIDKNEQKERFEERLNNPEKNWKFNPGDMEDRKLWSDYEDAFEDVFSKCSSKDAPWYIIPANKKWYRNVIIAQVLIETLESMKLEYPSISYDPSSVEIPD